MKNDPAMKHVVVTMALLALGLAGGCTKEPETHASNASSGGEAMASTSTPASAAVAPASDTPPPEASCGQGACS